MLIPRPSRALVKAKIPISDRDAFDYSGAQPKASPSDRDRHGKFTDPRWLPGRNIAAFDISWSQPNIRRSGTRSVNCCISYSKHKESIDMKDSTKDKAKGAAHELKGKVK